MEQDELIKWFLNLPEEMEDAELDPMTNAPEEEEGDIYIGTLSPLMQKFHGLKSAYGDGSNRRGHANLLAGKKLIPEMPEEDRIFFYKAKILDRVFWDTVNREYVDENPLAVEGAMTLSICSGYRLFQRKEDSNDSRDMLRRMILGGG